MEAYFKMKNTHKEQARGEDKNDMMLMMMQMQQDREEREAERDSAREERETRAAHERSVQMMHMIAAIINPAAGLALVTASSQSPA